MNNKSTEKTIRCQGTKAQYWTLKLILNGETVSIHTSKDYSYILEVERNFLSRNSVGMIRTNWY
jgi:hypothetical protein